MPWAGAEPHAPVPSLKYPSLTDDDGDATDEDRFLGWTPIEEAAQAGHVQILERLGPDPSRDDFGHLYASANSSGVIELLARHALPTNVGEIINRYLWSFGGWNSDRWRYRERLRSLFGVGARWETSQPDEIASVRRTLLKLPHDTFLDVMQLLGTDEYCSETILRELARTPSMRERMKKVGLIPKPSDESKGFYQTVTPRSRKVLAKFGIELPKPVSRIPPWVEIGRWRAQGDEVNLTRAELFECVWSEPVSKLAKKWGLSDRGLGKVCLRLKIPVPPRGYWARLQHGQKLRRPSLPELKPGEAEKIVIRLPE